MALSTIKNDLAKRLANITSYNVYDLSYESGITKQGTSDYYNKITKIGNVCHAWMRFKIGSSKVTGWTTFATIPEGARPTFTKQKSALLATNNTDGGYLRAYFQIHSNGTIKASGDMTANKEYEAELIYLI